MRTEGCREWRELLGARALGGLSEAERTGLEAHLEGCPACRAEAGSLQRLSLLLAHGDPDRFGPSPTPPAQLGERVLARIGAARSSRRRRQRFAVALGAAAAILVALAIVLLPGGGEGTPEQRVTFGALPPGVRIYAELEPHSFGTEIRMRVQGVRSGTLCRVFLRGRDGALASAGSFRYRWGEDYEAALSSALDLSRTRAIVVRAGDRTFSAPVGDAGPSASSQTNRS